MVHHGLGVVDSDDTLGCLLHFLWGIPWIIDVFGWKALQYGQITPECRDREGLKCKIFKNSVRKLNKYKWNMTDGQED